MDILPLYIITALRHAQLARSIIVPISPAPPEPFLKSLTSAQRRLLATLVLINFINFADRLVIVPLFPILRDRFQLNDSHLGMLQTSLQVVLALATVPFALMADRISRTRVIAWGVIIWSLATFLSGMAQVFTALLIARAFVGVGEAAYSPAAQSMISGAFPRASRARAQSIFAAGMLVGGAAGQALGGWRGEMGAWRHAFFVVGVPGLLLGMAVLGFEEPARGPRQEVVPISHILRVPAFLALMFSGVLITFSSLSFITWGADYMVEYKGFRLRDAGMILGIVGLISLVLGALTGGLVADWLQRRKPYGRIIAIAMAFLLAAPFLLWALAAEEKSTVLTTFFIACFFMSWYHGPVTAVIHDMMPERVHATSVGLYMLVTQLAGAFGPQLVGHVSDILDLQVGLQIAVAVMAAGALSFLLVIYFIRRHGLRHPALDAYRQL